MIKGCQREIVVLQTQESPVFESAYFILRRRHCPPPETDMVAEANRILAAGGDRFCHTHKKGGRLRCLWAFLAGLLTGGGLFLVLWLLL